MNFVWLLRFRSGVIVIGTMRVRHLRRKHRGVLIIDFDKDYKLLNEPFDLFPSDAKAFYYIVGFEVPVNVASLIHSTHSLH